MPNGFVSATCLTGVRLGRPSQSPKADAVQRPRLVALAGAAALTVVGVAYDPAQAADGLNVCPETVEATGDGCWQPLDGRPNCHVWNPNPQPNETAAFEGRKRCRDGKLSVTGTLTWTVREDGEIRSSKETGRYSEGKVDGRFVVEHSDGWRAEGRYVDGKRDGEWVIAWPVGTGGKWDRMEGPYVDDARQGEWVMRDYDSEGNLIGEDSGPYVDGARQGNWVEVRHSEDPGFRTENRSEGPYAVGKRHGEWSGSKTTLFSGGVSREHVRSHWVEGARNGPSVEVSYTLDQPEWPREITIREAQQGDIPRNHRRSEGSYVEGKRAGQWVTVEHPDDFVLRDDGAYADGEKFSRTEGAYADGVEEGAWETVSSNGIRVTETFVGGMRHGEYEAREADGSLLIAARAAAGEVTEISLPKAMPAPSQAEGSEYATVVGAFGLSFRDLNQLKPLQCGYSTCLTGALRELHSWATMRVSSLLVGLDSVIPDPIARAIHYRVRLSPHVGITEIEADLMFESQAEAENEASRINGLLREKYGECRDYRSREEYRRVAGQCDANGLPLTAVLAISAGPALRLTYELLSPAERGRVVAAWKETGEVRASDL